MQEQATKLLWSNFFPPTGMICASSPYLLWLRETSLHDFLDSKFLKPVMCQVGYIYGSNWYLNIKLIKSVGARVPIFLAEISVNLTNIHSLLRFLQLFFRILWIGARFHYSFAIVTKTQIHQKINMVCNLEYHTLLYFEHHCLCLQLQQSQTEHKLATLQTVSSMPACHIHTD